MSRAAAEDLAPVLADDRVAGLFRGLDFARVDDQAGNISSLIQEIWRLFLVAMMVAMVVEAGLCLPRPAARGRRRHHERLPIPHLPLDARGRWRCRSSLVAASRPASASSPGGAAATAARWGCSSSCGSRWSCLAAVMLNQPEWIEEYRPEEKPSVAVLWDASPSMDTRDVVARGKPLDARPGPAREADRRRWPNRPPGLKLRERMNVVVQPFSPAQAGHGHRSARAPGPGARQDPEPARHRPGLRRRLERRAAAGAGRGPAAGQGRARLRRRRWAARPACPTSSCSSLDAPTFGVAGKSVRIPFTIESSLAARVRHHGHAAVLRRRRGHQGSADRPDEPHQRLDRLEAAVDRRLHAHARGSQARRRDR